MNEEYAFFNTNFVTNLFDIICGPFMHKQQAKVQRQPREPTKVLQECLQVVLKLE